MRTETHEGATMQGTYLSVQEEASDVILGEMAWPSAAHSLHSVQGYEIFSWRHGVIVFSHQH